MHANSTTRVRTIFAGTPDFAVPSLQALHAHPQIDVVAVYTQPDKPAGRGQLRKHGSVKQAAMDFSIPVLQPTSLKSAAETVRFQSYSAELLVVAAYGLILPQEIIDTQQIALNVHASLLPRWRGAAPIQRAIMAGDQHTGITMMRVVEKLDAGPILLQKRCAITASETAGSLHDKLMLLGAKALTTVIDDWLTGRINETPQNESKAVYANKITTDDRILDWTRSAVQLERQVRALYPSPIATMKLGTERLKVWSADVVAGHSRQPFGTVVATGESGIDIATGDRLLRITRLQPDGKRAMSALDFINGFRRLLPVI